MYAWRGGPAAPAGLIATPGVGSIGLTWNAVPGAASYNVYQSLTPGGPYTPVQSGVTGSSTFGVGGLATGTTYYFVVTAVRGLESRYSNEAGAAPAWSPALLPAGQVPFWSELPTAAGRAQDVANTVPAAANNDPLARVPDLSPNNHHLLLTGAAGLRPLLKTAGGPNGLAYAQFDGADDFLQMTLGAGVAQPYTAFHVVKGISGFGFDSATSVEAAIYAAGGFLTAYAGAVLTSTQAVPLAAWHVVEVRFDGVNSKIRVDGVQVASGDAGANALSGLTVGASYAGTTPSNQGWMGGLVLAAGTAQQESDVREYFRAKAGTP
jgi:hypothetical protein